MQRAPSRIVPVCVAALAALGPAAAAQLAAEPIVTGLSRPLFVTTAPGEPGQIFIVEQREGTTGRVRTYDLGTGTRDDDPFLTVPGVSTGNEQGLLGLAFSPDYDESGVFYIYYTDAGGASTLERRFRTQAGGASDARELVLRIPQPAGNHNGGWMSFGPDGLLYIAVGDGGGANDPFNNGQDITTSLGVILRLDVSGADDFPDDPDRNFAAPAGNPFAGPDAPADARPEIWHYGLRNPWCNDFDPGTGDLYIADVGQGAREEVNVRPAGSGGGANFGWPRREGFIATPGVGGPRPAGNVDPVFEYAHEAGRCSITGGAVYRGADLPESFRGRYFLGDFCTGEILSGVYDADMRTLSDVVNHTAEIGRPRFSLTSFGRDARGEMYLCDNNGGVVSRVIFDCDGDGVSDAEQFAAGTRSDADRDGLAEQCGDCPLDLSGDGSQDFFEVIAFLEAFSPAEPSAAADADRDGDNDADDITALLTGYAACAPG